MTAKRLVIFDVDGTLVDSQDHIAAAMVAAFASTPYPLPTRAEILSIVGLSLPEAFAVLAPDADKTARADLVERYKASFATARAGNAQTSPLYPGARAALAALSDRADIVLGVATGKSARGLRHVLHTHDLTGMFQTEQVADHHPSKPHPAMLLAALEETGIAAQNAVMIGDTEFDMHMAKAAGVQALAVTWGYHGPARLLKAAPDGVIDRFEDLIPTLQSIWESVI